MTLGTVRGDRSRRAARRPQSRVASAPAPSRPAGCRSRAGIAILAVLQSGALGTSDLDAKLQQAKDSSGTGAKDVTGKAITQLDAGRHRQVEQAGADQLPHRADLDVANDFQPRAPLGHRRDAASLMSPPVLIGIGNRRGVSSASPRRRAMSSRSPTPKRS
jgi:hypothetical protein